MPDRFAHEDTVVIIRVAEITKVGGCPAGRCVSPSMREVIAFHFDKRVHTGLSTRLTHIIRRLRHNVVRISCQHGGRQKCRDDGIAVGAIKPMAPAIHRVAKLPHSAVGFKLQRVGVEAEILSRNLRLDIRFSLRSDLARAVIHVDPVIDAPPWVPNLHLRVRRRETVKQHFADIRNFVSIGILQKQDLCFCSDQQAAFVGHDAVSKIEFIREYMPLVCCSVVIGVLQHDDF